MAGPHAIVCEGSNILDPCVDLPGGAAHTEYRYDVNGNLRSREKAGITRTFSYTGEGRIRKIVEGSVVLAEYFYGSAGERVASLTPSGTFRDFGPMYRIANGVVEKSYFAGDERVAVTRGSAPPRFYVTDHLGSVRLVTTVTGDPIVSLEYDAFGEERGEPPPLDAARHRFTGKEREESGLYDHHARRLDVRLGSFTSPDSFVPHPADPQSLNRYMYTRNNPINRVDSDGHKDKPHGFWEPDSLGQVRRMADGFGFSEFRNVPITFGDPKGTGGDPRMAATSPFGTIITDPSAVTNDTLLAMVIFHERVHVQDFQRLFNEKVRAETGFDPMYTLSDIFISHNRHEGRLRYEDIPLGMDERTFVRFLRNEYIPAALDSGFLALTEVGANLAQGQLLRNLGLSCTSPRVEHTMIYLAGELGAVRRHADPARMSPSEVDRLRQAVRAGYMFLNAQRSSRGSTSTKSVIGGKP